MAQGMLSSALLLLAACVTRASADDRCHAPGVHSKCHSQVMNGMLAGFEKHPDDYPGLNTKSNYRDFQAFFWNNGMHGCPRPCMAHEEPCVPFDDHYPCWNDVRWAAEHGLEENPEWYPELRPGANWKDIALVLYVHGQPGCPRPCDDGEVTGHHVPYSPDKKEDEEKEDEEEDEEDSEEPHAKPEKGPRHNHEDDEDEEEEEKTPEEVARLEYLIQSQADREAVHKVQAESDDCARPGFEYTPIISEPPRSCKSSNECRAHCRTWPGAGYFTFYATLGMCHCAPYGATRSQVADSSNLAGELDCGATWEEINEDTAKIVEAVDSGCYRMNVGFGPMIGEAAPEHVKDAVQCHKKLLTSGVVAAQHFSYDTRDGTCRIVAPGAQEMQMIGFMSGSKTCKDANMLEFKADVGQQVKLPSPSGSLMRFVGFPMCALIVLIIGAFIGVRRRLPKRVVLPSRLRSEDLEGLEEPCIEQ